MIFELQLEDGTKIKLSCKQYAELLSLYEEKEKELEESDTMLSEMNKNWYIYAPVKRAYVKRLLRENLHN